jgi:hypothetical protein
MKPRERGEKHSVAVAQAADDLEDQAGMWKLLRPEEIGVRLTLGFMMDPEASASARLSSLRLQLLFGGQRRRSVASSSFGLILHNLKLTT